MKKKIIFVHTALWVGGIETALAAILNRFDYSKYDVTCLILSDNRALADRIPKECNLIFADRYNTVSFKNKYKYGWLFGLFQKPQNASKLRLLIWRILQFFLRPVEERLYAKYIKKNLEPLKYDTAVLFSSKVCGVAVKSLDYKKCLCFYHYSQLERVYHDFCGYRRCTKIFAVSENITERLKDFMPEYKDKLFPLHNLVDTKSIKTRSQESPDTVFDGNEVNLVSCARLNTDKGFDLAIDACRILNDKGYKFKWYVMGEGPARKDLEKQIADTGVENFILLGQKINPYPMIKNADIFVQPSVVESFGLTITESLVLGVPVVSTKTDGGKELITDGKTGLLCDISAESIAESLEKLLKKPEMLKTLRENISKLDFEEENENVMKKLYAEID